MTRIVAPGLLMAGCLLIPSTGRAAPPEGQKAERTARVQKGVEPKACNKPAVEVVGAGAESAIFALTKCDGTAASQAVERLSILARPSSASKPKESLEKLARAKGPELASGVRRIEPRLVQRLELAVDHFAKGGQTPKIQLYSGYRPKSAGSYHQTGRALDFKIEGVSNEALVAFCKTLPDTGCGYYPNSLFAHMDVRDAGAGHVSWIDASKPGETPRYVGAWPPPGADGRKLPALPAEPEEDQPASGKRPRDGHVFYF